MAELCAPCGFGPLARRNHDIQVVVLNLIVFTIFRSMCKFCTNRPFLKFTFLKHIAHMPCDDRALPAEQFTHLILGQPDRFFFKTNAQLDLAVFRKEQSEDSDYLSQGYRTFSLEPLPQ